VPLYLFHFLHSLPPSLSLSLSVSLPVSLSVSLSLCLSVSLSLCLSVTSVRDLSTFVQDTALGLASKVSDGDYAGLVDIMGHLMAIRDRQISTEQHFQPLTSTAELLKTYGQQLPESVYTQLEVSQSGG